MPLDATGSNEVELAIGVGGVECFPGGPAVGFRIVEGIGALVRFRFGEELFPGAAVDELDADGNDFAGGGVPAGGDIRDGDVGVVGACLPVEFFGELRLGPGFSEIIGAHVIDAGIVVGDAEVFLQGGDDDWHAILAESGNGRDAGMEPAEFGAEFPMDDIEARFKGERSGLRGGCSTQTGKASPEK